MVGEWQPPDGSEITGPPRDNPVVGHIVQRLFNMVHPPEVSRNIPLVAQYSQRFCQDSNVDLFLW